ncbi:hypothetical protein BP00DRAFT_332403 [Aspergillus indologenus CBS 114.80]|uniref:HBS1-like protein N-terminal domain-containing protein n=1 Tax=Aspergillus indologenus CBS 114.80 TaxID=1450541 RepID=A0A2V5IQ82_9EURO|nr:hypothetical protein BP00DRAFT_332403 [Aspergillus indologenus CBS 114.80]
MSRHRVKAVSYDDEDDYDDGYYSPDPEEQEFREQCTTEVLNQLRAGEPSVTATRSEVQDALYHYYDDVEKSVNYLRGKKIKELQKKQAAPPVALKTKGTSGKPFLQRSPSFSCISRRWLGSGPHSTGALLGFLAFSLPVPVYPAPPLMSPSPAAHFSVADFFRDAPWLNVPAHRKGEILVEPLYPRLGLLGGAPEGAGGGKVSKLAALAAARRKKEGDKAAATAAATPPAAADTPDAEKAPPTAPIEPKGAPLSLRERLAASGKPQKPASEGLQSLRALGKGSRQGSSLSSKKPSPEPKPQESPKEEEKEATSTSPEPTTPVTGKETEQAAVNIRAPPSTFASAIVGVSTRPKMTEPSHLSANTLDLIRIYGQDLAEPFDFAGPSPDDVVINAQSSAKGLAIRRKV